MDEKSIHIAWLGDRDLRAAAGEANWRGPIAEGLVRCNPAEARILHNRRDDIARQYLDWLKNHLRQHECATEVSMLYAEGLDNPTDFAAIYEHSRRAVNDILAAQIVFNISPGTPQMIAALVLIAKTSTPRARLISTSEGYGVTETDIPFDVTIEYRRWLRKQRDEDFLRAIAPPEPVELGDLNWKSPAVTRAAAACKHLAGTARIACLTGPVGAMHDVFADYYYQHTEQRAKKEIPLDDLDAISAGELAVLWLRESPSLSVQQQLLDLFEDEENQYLFLLVGDKESDLWPELHYRLAPVTVRLPALIEARADFPAIIPQLLELESSTLTLEAPPECDATFITALSDYNWPGNFSELRAVIRHVLLWSPPGERLSGNEALRALHAVSRPDREQDLLSLPLQNPIDIERDVLDPVKKRYVQRALIAADGVKAEAARLLGMHPATFGRWQKALLPDWD